MKQFIKIGLRNIFRNKRRFIFTVISILFGVVVSTILRGFINSIQKELESKIIKIQTGDLQVSQTGYNSAAESFRLDKTFEDNGKEVEILKNSLYVEAFTSRLKFNGWVSNGKENTTFVSIACDPKAELNVCPKIVEHIIEGRFLSVEDENEIVISKFLAEGLGLQLNDQLILLVKTRDGVINTAYAKICGFFAPMIMGDKQIIYVHIHMARTFLDIGKESTEYAIRLKDNVKLADSLQSLSRDFKKAGCAVDLMTWEQIMIYFNDVMVIQNVFNVIITIILFVIVTTTIVNTILMTVYKRTRGIGIMKALGMKSWQVICLFMIEGCLYGLIGGILGLIIAQVIIEVISLHGGVEYTFPVQIGAPKSWIISPEVTMLFRTAILIFAMISGIAASFYPALKASKMKIVDILRERILYR